MKVPGVSTTPGTMGIASVYELAQRRRQATPASPVNAVNISDKEAGSGTAATLANTAMQPCGHAELAITGAPPSGTNTNPVGANRERL
jgi:hypothetical protein